MKFSLSLIAENEEVGNIFRSLIFHHRIKVINEFTLPSNARIMTKNFYVDVLIFQVRCY